MKLRMISRIIEKGVHFDFTSFVVKQFILRFVYV